MTTKQCFKCKKEQDISNFYRHSKMKDGVVGKCKECNKKDVRDNRAEKIDYYREYDKQRANNPNRVLAREEYSKTDAGKKAYIKAHKKWIEANLVKRSAQIIVGNAVRDKKLVKASSCSSCGAVNKRLEGHHCDYAKPLEVLWLCSKCHSEWHKHNKPINGD